MNRLETSEAMDLFSEIEAAVRRYSEKTGHRVSAINLDHGELELVAVQVVPSSEIQLVYTDEAEERAKNRARR